VDGALKILMQEGDWDKHNRLIKQRMLDLQDEVDVFVLAQGSMVVLLPKLCDIRKSILSSPRLGVEEMRKILFDVD
jgi:hypothetical protein